MLRLRKARQGHPAVRLLRQGAGQRSLGVLRLFLCKARGGQNHRHQLDHGADSFLPTSNGTTPLMVAAGVGHAPGITRSGEGEALRAVRLLVELGADVNAVNASVDRSNPAIYGHRKSGHFRRPETGVEFYFTASSERKAVWTLVRQLRGPHLSTWA